MQHIQHTSNSDLFGIFFISYYSIEIVFTATHFHWKIAFVYLTWFFTEVSEFELWVIEGLDGRAVTLAIFFPRLALRKSPMKIHSTVFPRVNSLIEIEM